MKKYNELTPQTLKLVFLNFRKLFKWKYYRTSIFIRKVFNMDNLNFRNKNPSAVQYGNFINYYQFHPPEQRISLLPCDIWGKCDSFVALDIGCNSGDLTNKLYEFLHTNVSKNCYILAIDIDPILIERAKEKNTHEKITYHCIDFMNTEERYAVINSYLSSISVPTFNTTFCFSITMWIHLNNGDEGFKQFLYEISLLSDTVVLEPQSWKSYRAAVKRLKSTNEVFPLYESLKIRSNIEGVTEHLMCEYGGSIITRSEMTTWKRRILFFKMNR